MKKETTSHPLIDAKIKKEKCYMLTKSQLDKVVRDKISAEIKRMEQEAFDNAVNTTMVLLLGLPMEVLMDHYWTKGYAQRMPEFTEHVLEYYKQWQDGNLDLETVKEDLWRYAGVKLEVEGNK